MLKLRLAVSMFSVGLMVLGGGVVSGQDYPNKPIRILTTGGGAGDFVSRLIAPVLAGLFGQPVIVDNRSGIVTLAVVAKATPDGYTLLVYGSSLWIGPLLQKMDYDPVRDFAPVSLLDRTPNILAVHPSLPVESVKELIAYAKARPGELNYAAGATGSSNHLAGELFKSMAGVNIVAVPYKSSGTALNDLIGGQVQVMFGVAASVAPHIKSGRLNALGVASLKPSALFPDLPTVASSLPGYESGSLIGLWVPPKTPAMVVNRLNREIVRALNNADVKERLLSSGVEGVGSSPREFATTIQSEMSRLGKVIKDGGIRVE